MSVDARDLWRRLDRLEGQLAGAVATLVEVRELVACLNLLEASSLPVCPRCGPIRLPIGTSVDDHLRNTHGIEPEGER